MRKLSCVASVNRKRENNNKNGVTVASKMRLFITEGLLELSQDISSLPQCTYFTHTHPNMFEDFLFELQQDFPDTVCDKDVFMSHMGRAFDSFSRTQWGSRLSRGSSRGPSQGPSQAPSRGGSPGLGQGADSGATAVGSPALLPGVPARGRKRRGGAVRSPGAASSDDAGRSLASSPCSDSGPGSGGSAVSLPLSTKRRRKTNSRIGDSGLGSSPPVSGSGDEGEGSVVVAKVAV